MAQAVEHAYRILNWQENLERAEIPPAYMWPFEEELELWFEDVDRKRKERYGITDDDSGDTNVSMMGNKLAEGRR